MQRTSGNLFKKFNFKLQHSMGNKKIVKRYNFILAIICGFNSPRECKSTRDSYISSSNINTNFNAFQCYWCISYDKLQTSICQEMNNIQLKTKQVIHVDTQKKTVKIIFKLFRTRPLTVKRCSSI